MLAAVTGFAHAGGVGFANAPPGSAAAASVGEAKSAAARPRGRLATCVSNSGGASQNPDLRAEGSPVQTRHPPPPRCPAEGPRALRARPEAQSGEVAGRPASRIIRYMTAAGYSSCGWWQVWPATSSASGRAGAA